ncbi:MULTISPECIES: Lsr2 family protein [unclassified Plantibacter]|uniref:histone-like nucleoid-structuring protein Lsr2 n=1 Tax=unclassified Plantibacter TaxID=2624265 RepID=UPI000AD9BAE1|nr:MULTISPECIES: Lsr2 family protein [unclassified Plantibacter]
MATRTITTLIDDLDGSDIPRGLGETVRFGIDGENYEIDLTDENAAALRETLSAYVEAARPIVAAASLRRLH